MNTVTLTGNLTKDIELKTSQGNKSFCNFTIAVKKSFSTDSIFVDCIAWGTQAEFLKNYAGKGKRIGVVGEIDCYNYQDSNGNNRKATRVIARQVEGLWSRENNSNANVNENANFNFTAPQAPQTAIQPEDELSNVELPFEI